MKRNQLTIVHLLMAYFITVMCSCLAEQDKVSSGSMAFELDGNGFKVITVRWDSIHAKKSILYGNETAMKSFQDADCHHVPGEVFTLVTLTGNSNGFTIHQNLAIENIETIKFKRSTNNSLISEYSKTPADKSNTVDKQQGLARILHKTVGGVEIENTAALASSN